MSLERDAVSPEWWKQVQCSQNVIDKERNTVKRSATKESPEIDMVLQNDHQI